MELNTPAWVKDNFGKCEAIASKPVQSLRQKAINDINESGFPTTKLEDWKYTNVAPVLKTTFELAKNISEDEAFKAGLKAVLDNTALGLRLVFINGRFSQKLSELEKLQSTGIEVSTLSKAISADSKLVSEHLGRYALSNTSGFVALNTACIEDGIVISCKSEAKENIEIVYFTTGKNVTVNPRLLLIAEDDAKVTVIERFVGEGTYLNNYVAEITLGKNAKVDHYKIQEESVDATHVSRIETRQQTGSNYENHAFNFGAKLTRNEINPTLQGEHAYTLLHGLNILNADQHIDNQTVLDHAMPNCDSREWYKGIYSDKSKGIFSGTIIVRQDAQKTNAFQSNQSLLLSDEAESNSKPQLKIWADDVKCSHGATVGQLDQDAMFYLRSRGVPKKTAEGILITAFAGDILLPVKIDALRAEIEKKVLAKLTF